MLDQDKRKITKIAESAIKTVSSLFLAYEQLADLFKKEYEAIEDHDICEYEKTSLSKNQIVEQIVASTKQLEANCLDICAICSIEIKIKNLACYSEELRAYLANLSKESSYYEVLYKLQKRLLDLFELFLWIKPQAEKNRFILRRLIKNHQDSYKFWTWLAKEDRSSYNAKGGKDEVQSLGQFQIKA